MAAKEQEEKELGYYREGGGGRLPPARAVFCNHRILPYFMGYS